jgi:predicted ArsR family transcriptional regulator
MMRARARDALRPLSPIQRQGLALMPASLDDLDKVLDVPGTTSALYRREKIRQEMDALVDIGVLELERKRGDGTGRGKAKWKRTDLPLPMGV